MPQAPRLVPLTSMDLILQFFHSFFQTLQGEEVVVHLKNDLALKGRLHSTDQYMNFKLEGVHVLNADRFPQFVREIPRVAGCLVTERCMYIGRFAAGNGWCSWL